MYVASVEKFMGQSNQYDLQKQIAANSSGFLVNLGSFCAVLDTYQGMAKTFVMDVLHATFFLPRGEADVPQAIAGRIDYLHQMLGLQTKKDLCGKLHPVRKWYPTQGGRAALRFSPKGGIDGQTIVDMKGPESASLVKAIDRTQISSAPALSATNFFLSLFRQVCSEGGSIRAIT